MENLNSFAIRHFKISSIFFALGLICGVIYSINLLGYSINSPTLNPANIRSLHISLMLYGFIPLMLSYLPFFIINKEIGFCKNALKNLELYTIFWYIFLIYMSFNIIFGNTRGLAFYDFPYQLNFILAFAGVFYIIALYQSIRLYDKKPLWVTNSLKIVAIAPIALIILMNPFIGQVEKTVTGPHGDNTLGMSFTLIPIYYLIIKLISKEDFKARYNILWIIPLVFYILSVLHRSFLGELSYNQEWFFQYLTLLYVPLLIVWFKDAKLEGFSKLALLISIIGFLFVDIEGNILFIPEIRWVFHRNDLVIAHAHIAMGVAIFFMVIAIFSSVVKELENINFYKIYLFGLVVMATILSISGFIQAGYLEANIWYFWLLRTLFGLVVFASIFTLFKFNYNLNPLQQYNLLGVLADGFGGIFLILLAPFLYPLLGFSFDGNYEYVVFIFVCTTGVIHLFALIYKDYIKHFTNLTVVVRVLVSSVFISLYFANTLGIEALFIALFDLIFASIYLIFFHRKESLCQKSL